MEHKDLTDNAIFNAWNHPLKDHFYINEKNDVILKNDILNREYKLGPVKENVLDTYAQNCIDNYNVLKAKFDTTQAAWENTEDKLSLKSDVFNMAHALNKSPLYGEELSRIATFIHQAEKWINDTFNKNKSIKEAIIAQAKDLANSTDWKETTEKFKVLQEEWKNSPEIAKSDYEALNAQFIEYKNTFFNARNAFLETQYMLNWDKKIELCEKAESLQDSEDWKAATDTYKQLFNEWKTIGNVTSAEKNEELWNRFNAARQHFFDRKNAHSENIKSEQQENLQKKLQIVQEAEALAQSTEWRKTQEKLEQLQALWDSIGRVPQEHSDELWDRWRKAKDTFYEAKKKFNKEYLKSLTENYERKLHITLQAEKLALQNQWKNITDELAKLLEEWKSIGPIPREYGDELWIRFNEARRLFFKRKDEDRELRKKQIAEKSAQRIVQTENFIKVLQEELNEDLSKIEEFKANLQNIDGDTKKDHELKDHLNHLIQQLEKQISKRTRKIEDVKKQLEDLIQLNNSKEQ